MLNFYDLPSIFAYCSLVSIRKITIFNDFLCVILRLVGSLRSHKPVYSWVALATQTCRPKSVCNRCVIEFVDVFFFTLLLQCVVNIGAFVIRLGPTSSHISCSDCTYAYKAICLVLVTSHNLCSYGRDLCYPSSWSRSIMFVFVPFKWR